MEGISGKFQSAKFNGTNALATRISPSRKVAESFILPWHDKALTAVVEFEQEIYSSITSRIEAGMAMIKNETLYNLTLESPLLRDYDILDGRIVETWRGAPHFPLRYPPVNPFVVFGG